MFLVNCKSCKSIANDLPVYSGFQLNVVILKQINYSDLDCLITKDKDNPVKKIKLLANICSRRQSVRKCVSFTFDWLRRWLESILPIKANETYFRHPSKNY